MAPGAVEPHRLISADAHVVEDANLWRERVPARFRERAPHQVQLEEGDAWVVEGVKDPFPFGFIQCAGLPPEQTHLWVRWDEVRAEARDAKARLAAMDATGVEAEVLFPSPRLQNGIALNPDADFQLACVRAYNDWLFDWSSADPERLLGIALMPNVGIEAAITELERTLTRPGMRGILISQFPATGFDLSEEDDPLWARCVEAGLPVHVHVGLSGSPSGTPAKALGFPNAFTGAFRFYDPTVRIPEMIYARVFDRFPELKLVFAEVDVGWVPYVMEQLDDRYARQNPKIRHPLELKPSEYFARNVYFTIVTDRYGLKNRHAVGVDRILWSSDFPHAGCDFPDYASRIETDFRDIPEDEKESILRGNARKLYVPGP